MPRVDLPGLDNLVLQIGEDKWEPFTNDPAPFPPGGGEKNEQLLAAEALAGAPFHIRFDDDEVIHLSKDIITLYASSNFGEED